MWDLLCMKFGQLVLRIEDDILLQMMDYGSLTSASGKSVSCRNNIIIMTSNIGAEVEEKMRIGFGNHIDNSDRFDELFKSFFRPEFRSRLDAVIKFNKLGEQEFERVVLKIFEETTTLLKKKNIFISLSDNALKYLTKKSKADTRGARAVSSIIDAEIKPLLAEILLANENTSLTVVVEYIDQEIKILFQ